MGEDLKKLLRYINKIYNDEEKAWNKLSKEAGIKPDDPEFKDAKIIFTYGYLNGQIDESNKNQ